MLDVEQAGHPPKGGAHLADDGRGVAYGALDDKAPIGDVGDELQHGVTRCVIAVQEPANNGRIAWCHALRYRCSETCK